MVLKFTNTLSGELEEFTPKTARGPHVCLWAHSLQLCAHRKRSSIVIFDVLYRLLKREYKSVIYARNYTDVDDKINAKASADGVAIEL